MTSVLSTQVPPVHFELGHAETCFSQAGHQRGWGGGPTIAQLGERIFATRNEWSDPQAPVNFGGANGHSGKEMLWTVR